MNPLVNAISAALTSLCMQLLRHFGLFQKRRILAPNETFGDIATPGVVPKNDDPKRWAALVAKLRSLGFFDFVPSDRLEEVMSRCCRDHRIFDDAEGRSLFADAENLSEGGIVDWLTLEAAPQLKRRGVSIPPLTQSRTDLEYEVRVGSRKYPVHTSKDSELDMWTNGGTVTLKIVNDLLTASAHPDRLYWIHGAEDGLVAFLTPEMFETITCARLLGSNSWPYAAK